MERFLKNPYISNFMKVCPVGAELVNVDRRTVMTNLTVTFYNSANMAKNRTVLG
jgi:hypothetical protein